MRLRLLCVLFCILGSTSGQVASADQTAGAVEPDGSDGGTDGRPEAEEVVRYTEAPDAGRYATKFEAAVRLGFSLPFGAVTGYVGGNNYFDFTSLNQLVQYTGSVGADVGIRIAGVVFAGAYVQAALGEPNGTYGTTSASDVQVGAEILLHPLGIISIDPWLGVGAGYEWFTVTPLGADNSYASAQFGGWILLDVQAGVDFALGTALRIGPYVAFSMGQFDSFTGNRGTTDSFPLTDKTLHYWLTFGVRLVLLP